MIHKHGAWLKLAPLSAAQSDLTNFQEEWMEKALQISKVMHTLKGKGCFYKKQRKELTRKMFVQK